MWPHPTSRGDLRTVANQASPELSELLLMEAKGCGSVFPTIKTYPKDPTAVTQFNLYYIITLFK